MSGDEFAFFDSCSDGDVDVNYSLMKSGNIDVNYSDENGNTPLILSAKNGHAHIVTALLDAGADIELAAAYPAQVLAEILYNQHIFELMLRIVLFLGGHSSVISCSK